MRLASLWAGALGILLGCPADEPAAGGETGPAPSGTTGAVTTSGDTGSVDDDPAPDDADADSSSEGFGDDGIMGECSLFEQDCPNDESCQPWSDAPDLVPDDIRCCPNLGGGSLGLHGEPCQVEDYFGSCVDDCSPGHMCFDIDNDGTGICQKFCGGTPSNPVCEIDESCFIYFAGVPFCFNKCDPLVQDCVDGEGCYPDEEAPGGTGFSCLPTVGAGKLGDPCWLLSNCEPGLLCISPDAIPDCPDFAGCCSAICDTSQPDTCDDIVPGTECVNWYYAGQTPPSAALQDVGACIIAP